jgi:hypothetical protein
MPSLLDTAIRRGFTPGTCAMDKGYDGSGMYTACEDRDIRPVIPLKKTVNVVNGKHNPPSCQHGEWAFAGSDTKRGASKWRCPDRECQPASVWVKADRLHTLIPAPPTAGKRSTAPGARSNASSDASSTNGASATAGQSPTPRPAPRRPHHSRAPDQRTNQGASRPAGRVTPPTPNPPTAGDPACPHHETEP